jgi:hypothetical protein
MLALQLLSSVAARSHSPESDKEKEREKEKNGRGRERERGKEREREKDGGREKEGERQRKIEREMQNMVALFLFLTGMTGALAPFSCLVNYNSLISVFIFEDKDIYFEIFSVII